MTSNLKPEIDFDHLQPLKATSLRLAQTILWRRSRSGQWDDQRIRWPGLVQWLLSLWPHCHGLFCVSVMVKPGKLSFFFGSYCKWISLYDLDHIVLPWLSWYVCFSVSIFSSFCSTWTHFSLTSIFNSLLLAIYCLQSNQQEQLEGAWTTSQKKHAAFWPSSWANTLTKEPCNMCTVDLTILS